MKTISFTILLLFFGINWTLGQEADCARTTYFGEKEICLPKIEGYQECYLDSVVRIIADGTEVPINMVLGFYLNQETFDKRDSLGQFPFDDYCKVYGTKQIKDYPANIQVLKQMEDMLAQNFFAKNWDAVEKEVDKIGLELEIGVPTVVKSYKLTDNSFTKVMLTNYQAEGIEPYTVAVTLNGLLVNQRLIWMAYYLDYTGEEIITQLQERSDIILGKLLQAHK